MNNLIVCCGVVSSCDLMTKLIILALYVGMATVIIVHLFLLQLEDSLEVSLFIVTNSLKLYYILCGCYGNTFIHKMASYVCI